MLFPRNGFFHILCMKNNTSGAFNPLLSCVCENMQSTNSCAHVNSDYLHLIYIIHLYALISIYIKIEFINKWVVRLLTLLRYVWSCIFIKYWKQKCYMNVHPLLNNIIAVSVLMSPHRDLRFRHRLGNYKPAASSHT